MSDSCRVESFHLSLRQMYDLHVEGQIEAWKDSAPRSEIVKIGDEVVAKLGARDQVEFDELVLWEEVDRVINTRLNIPSFSEWKRNKLLYQYKHFRVSEPVANAPVATLTPQVQPGPATRIHAPPGMWLDRLAEFLFRRKTYEEVFVQLIADLRAEHACALSEGRTTRAVWLRLCYGVAFAEAVIRKAPVLESIANWLGGALGKTAKW
jgi:hypothetical protein